MTPKSGSRGCGGCLLSSVMKRLLPATSSNFLLGSWRDWRRKGLRKPLLLLRPGCSERGGPLLRGRAWRRWPWPWDDGLRRRKGFRLRLPARLRFQHGRPRRNLPPSRTARRVSGKRSVSRCRLPLRAFFLRGLLIRLPEAWPRRANSSHGPGGFQGRIGRFRSGTGNGAFSCANCRSRKSPPAASSGLLFPPAGNRPRGVSRLPARRGSRGLMGRGICESRAGAVSLVPGRPPLGTPRGLGVLIGSVFQTPLS